MTEIYWGVEEDERQIQGFFAALRTTGDVWGVWRRAKGKYRGSSTALRCAQNDGGLFGDGGARIQDTGIGELEVDVHADGFDEDGAAVAVVAGVVDELDVEGVVGSAPGVGVVVALEDVFAGVAEVAVAEEEAFAAEGEVGLVVALDGVGDKGEAELIVFTA